MVRTLRLVKLLRIVKASRILRRWEDHLSISFAWISLIQFLVVTIIMSHWLACCWGLTGAAAAHTDEDHP